MTTVQPSAQRTPAGDRGLPQRARAVKSAVSRRRRPAAWGPKSGPERHARADEMARAVRHTRRVRRLRIALPLVSGAIALGLLAAAVVPNLLPFSALQGLKLTAEGLVMEEPRLAGHLGEGRRYEVRADKAVQSLFTPSHLSLEGLAATLDMGAGESISLAGERATYDTDTEVLALPAGLALDSTDGNRAEVGEATVFLKDGRLEGNGRVDIASPRGRIRAGRIDIFDGGALIRMSEGVRILIDPAQ